MEDLHPLVDLDPVRTMDTLHNNRVHPQGFKTVMEAVGVADTTKAGTKRVGITSNAEAVKAAGRGMALHARADGVVLTVM